MTEPEKRIRDILLKNIEEMDRIRATEHIPAMCKAYRDFAKGCEKFRALDFLDFTFPSDQFATTGTTQNDN